MYMKSSTELPNNYNEIARQARETAESIYITMNGNGDTVIMGMESFERREQMLALRERLLVSEKERLAENMISLEDAGQRLQRKFDGKI